MYQALRDFEFRCPRSRHFAAATQRKLLASQQTPGGKVDYFCRELPCRATYWIKQMRLRDMGMCRRPPGSQYKSVLLAWMLLLAFSATVVPRCSGRSLLAGDCPDIDPCPFLLGMSEGNLHCPFCVSYSCRLFWAPS